MTGGGGRKTLIVATLAGLLPTLGFLIFFHVHDRPLRPYTIIDFELAWTPERAGPMLAAWGESGRRTARESLWVDFAFMPAYALLFAGGTLLAARSAAGRGHALGFRLAAAPVVAALLDVVENVSLLRVLGAAGNPPAAALTIAGAAAAVKFALLGVCLLYILCASAYHRLL